MQVKALQPFSFLIAVIVMVSLACSALSSTPAPEPQPVQNESPTPVEPAEVIDPTQPVAPSEPPVPAAQQYFTEEFDSDSGFWDLNVVKNAESSDPSKASAGITDGIYDFTIDEKNLTIYSFYTPYDYEDVKIDLLVENRGTNDNQINIICRATENGWYEFSIANSGLYVIYAVDENGYRKLHDGGSTKIKTGKEFNEYSVICKERTLSLFINGVETRVFEENEFAFSQGLVGIGVSSFNTLPVEIEINSVTISEP